MDIRPHPIKPPIERFLARIKVSTEHFYEGSACWDWQGSKGSAGYGQFVLDGRRDRKRVRIAPYRFIWEHFNGQTMAEGLEPDHLCNRRPCCNPAHIEPVTHAENLRRAVERRKAEGRKINRIPRPRPTHCPQGHEYTAANMLPGGKIKALQCRECSRLRSAAANLRRRAA